MNLSQVRVELSATENTMEDTRYREEEARIVRIIEAIVEIRDSKAWSSLKTEVFDNLVNVLERTLRTEAKKEDPSPMILNRISGELKWAERFSDLNKLENWYRAQLQGIRLKLHGNTESDA